MICDITILAHYTAYTVHLSSVEKLRMELDISDPCQARTEVKKCYICIKTHVVWRRAIIRRYNCKQHLLKASHTLIIQFPLLQKHLSDKQGKSKCLTYVGPHSVLSAFPTGHQPRWLASTRSGSHLRSADVETPLGGKDLTVLLYEKKKPMKSEVHCSIFQMDISCSRVDIMKRIVLLGKKSILMYY